MKLHISCVFLIVAIFTETTQSNENDTDTNVRRGRVNGRIVKLYSGIRPDPVLCSEEGFKADPNDCSVFYRCVQSFGGKYSVFRFQCGPGTVYDPATEVCNHASNTKRTECGGANVPLRQEINENDIDFQELPSPISTITPLYLSTNINASGFTMTTAGVTNKHTDQRSTSFNIPTTTTANQKFSEAFGNLGISWNKYTTSSQSPSSSIIPSKSDRSDPCILDGFVGDSYDCKKFYRCVNNFRGGFIRYEFVCGESTVWDDEKQSCNYASAVRNSRCGRYHDENRLSMSNNIKQEKPITSSYIDSTTKYQIENLVTDNANSINYGDKLDSYSPITSERPITNNIEKNKPLIPSYNDASNQNYNEYIVTNKHPVANHFNENQYNNYNPQSTENQIDYGVTSNPIRVDEIKKDYTESQTTSTEQAPSSSMRENSIKSLSNICLQSGFVGDPNDCQKFYRCVDSGRGSFTRYDFSCSQGTVWDSSIEACNHAWAVKGCGSKSQGFTTESSAMKWNSSMNINESEDNEEEDNDSDYGYMNQINHELSKITTPKVDITFSLPPTSDSQKVDKACPSSGFFKNTVDCKKFYKCIENGRGSFTRFDYNCGEGTLWDETIEACNHEWAVKSCKSSSERHNDTEIMTTITLVQTTTQKNINTNDDNSVYGLKESMTTPGTDLYSSTTSKETFNSKNRKCNRNGFMGDKEDCKKFYRCVDNGHNGYIRYEFSCGDGTVWDSSIEACNHERDVDDCRSSPSNNIDDNNLDPIDSVEDIDNGYVTPSNKDPDNSSQTTVTYTTTPLAENDKTPISENDNNNNICKSQGFIGDTENCEKFYRCVDNGHGGFSRIEFTCGEGTVWDSTIEACNHRWAVEKCGKSSNNEISETTSHSVATATNEMSEITTKSPEESHSSTQHTSTQQSQSNNECTSEGFFGMQSEGCKKFYRCVDNGKGGYTKYEFECGDGTVWDESIQACNHATNNVTCGKGGLSSTRPPQPDSTSTYSTNSVASTTPTSTTHIDAPEYDEKCTSEGFMADSSDCRKFFRCVDNGKGGYTKYEFSCGEGTVWVQEIQACDHDTDENICNTSKSTTIQVSSTITEEPLTSSIHGSPDNEVTAPISSTTENNYVNENDSDKCSSEGFYPNKYDCKRFYRCVDDGKGGFIKYEFTCAEGTAWDIYSQSCNYISEVSSCQDNKIPQTEPKPDSGDNAEPENKPDSGKKPESENKPDSGDNSESENKPDSGDNPESENKPDSGENPEPETEENTTTTKPRSTTTSTRPKQDICEEEGFFGDTEDCKKFYRCVSNEKGSFTKYDFTCGDGTIWDQDITACNHPRDVTNPSCRSDGSSSPASSTSTTTNVSNNTDYTTATAATSSPSTTLSTAGVSSTTAKDKDSNCSNSNKDNMNNNNYTCTKAGFYADPNDCKKFYRCVDWENNGQKFSIYHFDCGDGTIWDPSLETCNHEESVYPPRNCNGSQQQNQNNSESSSTTEIPSETESTSTYETTSTTIQQTETEPTTTTTQRSTTQSKPSTTTQKSTTQSKPTTTTTTTITTTTQRSTTTTTSETSTPQTSTTSGEEPTTEPATQSTTDASNTDQTTTNKESTSSEATSTNSYETTATTNQMTSTTEQPTTTTEVTSSTEEISPQTTESQSSTTDSTTTTTGQESTTEANSSSNKDCPDTEEDQYLYVCPTSFRRHPKYCNMFYQCTEDNDNHELKVAVFNCPNNTIYDESKTQCLEESKADKKCNGQMSRRNRLKRLGHDYNEPVVVSTESMSCSSAGHFPFEKHEKCSPALLKCEYSKSGKLKGYVYKCPEGFVYWTVSRRCEAIRKVKDCKRSSYPWDKRQDIPVERHNISL